MSAEDAETVAETALSPSSGEAQSQTLAEKSDAMDMLFENGSCDGNGNENRRVISERLNGNVPCSSDAGFAMKSEVIKTEIVIDEIFGHPDLSVLCNDAENGGGFDDKGLGAGTGEALDKGLEVDIAASFHESFGPLNVKVLSEEARVILGSGFLDVGVLCEDAERGGRSDSKESSGSENVTGGSYTCDDDESLGADKGEALDKGLQGKNEICVGESFGTSERKVLPEEAKVVVNSGFSAIDLDEVDKNGMSLAVGIPNDKCIGKCDGVESIDMENVGDQEHVYSLGDFVWSKFNSHPWWPGQIYDPSDASDHAKKCRQVGKPILVAYFGDGSFSWRSPSQLKPFAENFNELSNQSDSIIFSTAVQSALREIGRVAELEMTCPCVPEENKAGLTREGMVNTGIKEGVTEPVSDLNRLPVPYFESPKLLSYLWSIAVGNSVSCMLELTGMRSCLSAFYRARGWRKLVGYHEGLVIEGMQDKDRSGLSSGNDMSVLQKCTTGKRKGVAKLMKKHSIVKAQRKETKSIGESPISSMNNVSSFANGPSEDQEKSLYEKTGGVLEEETGGMTASRKRKKSRYLCYPYTDTNLSVKGSKWDLVSESVKISKIACVGERMTSAAANLTQSSPILNTELYGESDNGIDSSAFSGLGRHGGQRKKMIEPAKVKASPVEVLAKARSAALDHQLLLCSDSCDIVNDFIYAFRSVVFLQESTAYKPSSKKRKSLSFKPGFGVKDQNKTHNEMINISELTSEKKRKNKRAKKIMDGETNNEVLLFIKQKLEKMTSMVECCDGDMVPGIKLSLESEIKGLLEKMNTMRNTA